MIDISRLDAKKITLIATLAAVYALGSFLPGFPMIGVSGSKIDIVRSLEMGYGFVLGPILGPITAFLGAIVGKLMTGGGMGIFFTPLAFVSALVAACLSRDRIFKIKGWILAAAIMIVLIAGWYATPIGREAIFYPIVHLIGLGIILIFRENLAVYLNSEDKKKISFGTALCSFPSTLAGHMLGNLIFISLFSPSALFFMSVLPIAIVERVVITIISSFIATALIVVVRDIFPEIREYSRDETQFF